MIDKLSGYAVMIVRNVLCDGNTVKIHSILTPHTPMIVRMAGAREMPKPRRYPDIFSYNILNVYAEKTMISLVYPISITCGSLLNIESNVFTVRSTRTTTVAVAMKSSMMHNNTFLHRFNLEAHLIFRKWQVLSKESLFLRYFGK